MNKESYYDLIIRPIVSDKGLKKQSKGQFSFEVKKTGNKDLIRKAIEEIFDTKVSKVMTSRIKTPREYKKATITLKEGHSMSFSKIMGQNQNEEK